MSGLLGEEIALMWVGKRFYPTSASFTKEALQLGVSKRIASIPKKLVLGESWVYLAHPEGATRMVSGDDCTCEERSFIEHAEFRPAVVFVFRPTRIEMPMPKSTTEDKLKSLEKRGITPILCDIDRQGKAVEFDDEPQKVLSSPA
jgi:hypothetical protein